MFCFECQCFLTFLNEKGKKYEGENRINARRAASEAAWRAACKVNIYLKSSAWPAAQRGPWKPIPPFFSGLKIETNQKCRDEGITPLPRPGFSFISLGSFSSRYLLLLRNERENETSFSLAHLSSILCTPSLNPNPHRTSFVDKSLQRGQIASLGGLVWLLYVVVLTYDPQKKSLHPPRRSAGGRSLMALARELFHFLFLACEARLVRRPPHGSPCIDSLFIRDMLSIQSFLFPFRRYPKGRTF